MGIRRLTVTWPLPVAKPLPFRQSNGLAAFRLGDVARSATSPGLLPASISDLDADRLAGQDQGSSECSLMYGRPLRINSTES